MKKLRLFLKEHLSFLVFQVILDHVHSAAVLVGWFPQLSIQQSIQLV